MQANRQDCGLQGRNIRLSSCARWVLLAVLGTASAGISAAESEGGNQGIQEVVVTATRQAVPLSHVPASIEALTEEMLDTQHVENIDDLSRITPGITFTRSAFAGGEGTNISIRGISSTAGAATTGIYIDDTPIQVRQVGADSNNAYPKIFDLDRIEVLRGPQGTLFGAGAEGGAVRFITPEPSLTKFSLYDRAEASETEGGAPSAEEGVAVGGPLVDNVLGARVSAWVRHDGGYIDRVAYPTGSLADANSNWQNSYVIRGALKWAPTDTLSVMPAILVQDIHSNDASTYWEMFSNPSQGRFSQAAPITQPDYDKFYLPSLKVDYTLDSVRVVSNTSFFYHNDTGVKDYTTADATALTAYSPNPAYYPLPGASASSSYFNKQKNFTEEFRVEAADPNVELNYVFGIFYQQATQSTGQAVQDNYLSEIVASAYGPGVTPIDILGIPPLPGNYTFVDALTTTDRQLAGYGQLDWNVYAGITLSAGLRVSHTSFSSQSIANGPANGGYSATPTSQRDNPVTPKFTLSDQIDPSNMVYFTAAEGYRVGGGNTPVPTTVCGPALALYGLSSAPSSYDSDTLWSYEIGSKNSLFGGRLHISASAFHIDWNQIQSVVQLNCGFEFVSNLGQASSNGFDFDLQAKLTQHLLVGGSVAYTDATYSKSIAAAVGVNGQPTSYVIRSGDPVGATPWTLTLHADYEDEIVDDHDGFAHVDFQYSSRQADPYGQADANYDSNILGAPASLNLNARIGVRWSAYELALFANNINNQAPELSRWHNVIGDPLYQGATVRPRTIGLSGIIRY